MKRVNAPNLLLILLVITTLCAITLRNHLPKKSLTVIPQTDYLISYMFLSKPEGSKTQAEIVDGPGNSWQCISEEQDSWLVCSFSFLLTDDATKGWDLSSYSHVNIKLSYDGPAKTMRLALRNYDERFSTPEDANSSKFEFVMLRREDFNKEVQISLNEFTVSDWWIDQFDLPRNLARPDVRNVVAVGVEFVDGLPPGVHRVTLEKLSFSGDLISPESWYLGILGLWVFSSLIFVGLRMFALNKQSKLANLRINELATNNFRLQTEKNRFQTLSSLDALTGIYNRYAIDKNIALLSADPRNNSTAMLLIDIDHFKRVNDRRGHDVGDKILQRFALVVSNNIRKDDIFGRWGGEEFVLICPQTTVEKAFYLAEKIRKIISDTIFEEEKPLAITASFGVGMIRNGEDFASAFKRIDGALYKAKSLGRNCTVIAESDLPTD